jgi:hypothetical protein
MATWQYPIHLIPRSRLIQLFGSVPAKLDSQTFDSVEWWQNIKFPKEAESFLDSFLPRGTHWSEKALLWGDNESDHIDLWKPSNDVEEIFIRVHVGKLSRVFLEELIEFALMCDCVFYVDGEKLIEPDLDDLLAEIKESRAYHFVSDPHGFLRSIKYSQELKKEDEWEN